MRLGNPTSYLALFGSSATLICCALPVLLVSLGMGAALASITSNFPQLIFLSAHKEYVFAIAGVALGLAAAMQWRQRHQACPADPELARACSSARTLSSWVLAMAVILYLVGLFFAYLAPLML